MLVDGPWLLNACKDLMTRQYVLDSFAASIPNLGFRSLEFASMERFIAYLAEHKDQEATLQELVCGYWGSAADAICSEWIQLFEQTRQELWRDAIYRHLPAGDEIADIGCGRGGLGRLLTTDRIYQRALGFDVYAYTADWAKLMHDSKGNIMYEQAEPAQWYFAHRNQFSIAFLSYVLHHHTAYEQSVHLDLIAKCIKVPGAIVLVEDAISERLKPLYDDLNFYKKALRLASIKHSILDCTRLFAAQGVLDTISNALYSGRRDESMSLHYRTLEEWEALLKQLGLSIARSIFLGFPLRRDIYVPQSVIVAEVAC